MMKSFLKKLAFVMALAMVVTATAPAAGVFAAEVGVIDETKAVVTEKALAVGETHDFGFAGCDTWAEAKVSGDWGWTSDKEEVATVNYKGEVTGVADGVATITIKVGADYVQSVKVTVGAGEVVEEEVKTTYEITQKSHNEFVITFNKEYAAKDATVELYRVYDGGIEVFEYLEKVSSKDNVLTIQPYVEFEDGNNYIVVVNGEKNDYTTVIDKVDRIDVAWSTMGKEGFAFAGDEENNVYPEVVLSAKLFSHNVDVTNATGYAVTDVEFELVNENDDVFLTTTSDGKPALSFYKAGAVAVVNATYEYYDETLEEYITVPRSVEIAAIPLPKYAITNIVDWAVVVDGQEKVDWSVKDLAVNDEVGKVHKVVALLKDSFGQTYVTDAAYTTDDYALFGTSYSAGYTVDFVSTNLSKVLVGTDGDITTIGKSTAPLYVALYKGTEKVRNVGVLPLTVKAERKIDTIKFDPTTLALITSGDFTKESLKVTLFDQYGAAWGKNATVKYSTTVEGINGEKSATYAAGKEATIELDGAALLSEQTADRKVTSLKFTVKAGNAKNTFTVSLKKPSTTTTNGTTTVAINKWSLEANDVDMYMEKNGKGDNGTTSKSATVTFYNMNGSLKISVNRDLKLFTQDKLTKITSAAGYKLDDKVIVVFNPKNNIVTSGVTKNATSGAIEVLLANVDDNDVVKYSATGTYTARVYRVTGFDDKGVAKIREAYSDTFEVSNSNKKVSLKEQDKVTGVEATTLAAAALEAFDFTWGDKDLDESKIKVVSVSHKWNADSQVLFVKSVKMQVPLNNGDSTAYYEVTVNVDRAVTCNGTITDAK